ncbi:uncharacterized protein LOC125074163 [Vanessa atalanta]|uniref:uncharacterized protein LOC125074163 n=1 Tax=Vanessa atalanta TaxID=42275 RepID=UPI001FCCE131|nr:uncharacterized protein LOC125074163 [Vanessa atalanta]
MSACKNPKPELIAIYRLEFYKKQNNWKLSPTRKERKSCGKSSEKKKNLNVTYDLDHHDVAERSDPLNVAFVDSDSDKTTQTKLLPVYSDQRNKELSQEWLEPVNIWPRALPSEDPPKSSTIEKEKSLIWNIQTDSNDNFVERINSTQKLKTCTRRRLEELQKAARSEEFTIEQANNEGDAFKDDYQEGSELKTSWVDRNVDSKWKAECYQELPTDAGAVLDSGHTAQDIWTQAPEADVPDGFDYPDVINPEDWRPRLMDGGHWTSERSCEGSVDSEGEFVRGAHAAPHSSEAELALPAGLNTLDVSFSSLSRLSSSQLMVAARLHSRVLRRLLLESEQRQKLRNMASMNSISGGSFDEYPTRDIGLYDSGSRDNSCVNRHIFYNDVFLAGSYKNVCAEERGRGRGRLNETSLWR